MAKRLLAGLQEHAEVSNLIALEYLFNEDTGLPEIGGLEHGQDKRLHHPRLVVGLLLEHFGRDRLLFCIDPSSLEIIQEFFADQSQTRLLQIDCAFSDDYLIGHAQRVGLIRDSSSEATVKRLLPALRNDVFEESETLRAQEFDAHFILREADDLREQAQALAEFLKVTTKEAETVLESQPHLFLD